MGRSYGVDYLDLYRFLFGLVRLFDNRFLHLFFYFFIIFFGTGYKGYVYPFLFRGEY